MPGPRLPDQRRTLCGEEHPWLLLPAALSQEVHGPDAGGVQGVTQHMKLDEMAALSGRLLAYMDTTTA